MGDTIPECGVDDFMISGLHHDNLLTDMWMQSNTHQTTKKLHTPWDQLRRRQLSSARGRRPTRQLESPAWEEAWSQSTVSISIT